jgi:hypothetical protein
MALQYLGRSSGEVFEPGLGVRQKYTLSSNLIESMVVTGSTDNVAQNGVQRLYIKVLYFGDFTFDKSGLQQSLVSDISSHIYDPNEKIEVGSSVSFKAPLDLKPHEITNLNGATKVNYSYRSIGTEKPIGLPILENTAVTNDRSVLNGFAWTSKVADGWWEDALSQSAGVAIGNGSSPTADPLSKPQSYGEEAADVITNYNPEVGEKIQIDLTSFSGALGKLGIAKKSKQVAKLAKKDIDFIYDQQAGYLYYNENGKQPGLGDGGIFAMLEGMPKMGVGNFEFV